MRRCKDCVYGDYSDEPRFVRLKNDAVYQVGKAYICRSPKINAFVVIGNTAKCAAFKAREVKRNDNK